MKLPALALTVLIAASACGGSSTPSSGGALTADSTTGTADSAGSDTASADTSADTALPQDSSASADTSPADTAAPDTASDVASSNADCTFNADCIASERCECDEIKGCFCKIGARGTGKSGVDACKDGNDCETALCVEGPPSDKLFYCSGPCASAGDCKSKLPICSNIAFVGKVCIRDPKAP